MPFNSSIFFLSIFSYLSTVLYTSVVSPLTTPHLLKEYSNPICCNRFSYRSCFSLLVVFFLLQFYDTTFFRGSELPDQAENLYYALETEIVIHFILIECKLIGLPPAEWNYEIFVHFSSSVGLLFQVCHPITSQVFFFQGQTCPVLSVGKKKRPQNLGTRSEFFSCLGFFFVLHSARNLYESSNKYT